jgi:hypothetical protein
VPSSSTSETGKRWRFPQKHISGKKGFTGLKITGLRNSFLHFSCISLKMRLMNRFIIFPQSFGVPCHENFDVHDYFNTGENAIQYVQADCSNTKGHHIHCNFERGRSDDMTKATDTNHFVNV